MTVLIIFFGIYYFLLLVLISGWQRARLITLKPFQRDYRISVIVPFRNEAENIMNLIASLRNLDYDPQHFEIILCNDHSTDQSVAIAAQAITSFPNFNLIDSPLRGKKNALTFAIHHATGEVIVTTDADCHHPVQWLNHINQGFQDAEVQMVFGPVKIQDTGTFFSRLQVLEFASLVGSAAATSAFGKPIMCNAANLAFFKETFDEVKGYEGNVHIPSGDDEFLMRKIVERYPGSVKFLNAQEAIVTTRPQKDLSHFFRQRIRWAGKWRHNTSLAAVATAILIFCFQVSYLTLIITTIIYPTHWELALTLVATKAFLELIFLFNFSRFLKIQLNLGVFLVLQVVYPIYILATVAGIRYDVDEGNQS